MSETFTLRPIGVLSTPWQTLDACPRNGRQPDPMPVCEALVFSEFVAGLRDLEGFSHLILLYWLHEVRALELTVTPPFDGQPHGVFTTRSAEPDRPVGGGV
jgi:tRNA (Thr-GGU) A37 N-methylase